MVRLDVISLGSLEITREIFVVTELLDFDGAVTSRPHCMLLRGDLQRFVHVATQLRKTPLQEPRGIQ